MIDTDSKHNPRPNRLALVTHTHYAGLHPIRERDDVDASIVPIGRDERQSFLNALDGRTPLAGLGVMNPNAELQKDPDEVRLVTHSLEEKLLEAIARFQIFAFIEER